MPAGESTATRGTPYISDGSLFQASDLDTWSQDLKTFLEANMAGHLGTIATYAALPAAAAGNRDFFAYVTNCLAHFRSDGTAWAPLHTIVPMTTTQRNSLVSQGLWDGRTIYNSTTLQYESYNLASTSWVATNGGWVFASTAARDAAITAPIKGMEAIVTNIGTLAITLYDGTAWRTVEVWGTGSPESVITATVGAIFHRTDGTAGLVQYSKESGTGNTGWLPVGSASGADFAFFLGG